ncbi:hypothetical protein QJS10_CPB14g01202 [Acorus calamus]|uniref:Endonuclease/exonuclease/phosphatase domain-containing protein n=1 Tax=Acorus calamus TaxID=4465 RepID=A0AAV9DC15_ACOCL|nr:hypothetical protein QJS10_CPB14g01202 [Acorus calamus]
MIVIGDFNIVRRTEERNNMGPETPAMRVFSDWIEDEGLIVMPILNHRFTWRNLRERPSMARLDRILISDEWEAVYPGCHIWGLPQTISDHMPLLLQSGEEGKKKAPFRFESWWCDIEGVEELIRNSWNGHVRGLKGARRVAFKLRRLKRVLCEWSSTLRILRKEKLQGRLLTKVYRAKWVENELTTCALCDATLETVDHLFCECELVHLFWAKVGRRTGLSTNFQNTEELWKAGSDLKRSTAHGSERRPPKQSFWRARGRFGEPEMSIVSDNQDCHEWWNGVNVNLQNSTQKQSREGGW